MTEIYLDGNATGAVLPAAIDAAVQAMAQDYGNPSSAHLARLRARALLADVRQRAARLLGAGAGRLVCGATEHKAVPEILAHWCRLLGLELPMVELPVDAEGRHDLARLRELAPEAALVRTMAANNETGVVSDLAGIEQVLAAAASPALWAVDGAQALGKLPLELAPTRIDYATFSGHKLHAPKGVGLLCVRPGAPYTPLVVGGGQEAGQRSGTENMAGIAAFGAVLVALEAGGSFRGTAALALFRDRIVERLRPAFPDLRLNAPLRGTLPTTLNFSVPGLDSAALLNLFGAAGPRVSAGSACAAARAAPSPALLAMGVPPAAARSAVRLSFGLLIDAPTVDAACAAIDRCGAARHLHPAPDDTAAAAAAVPVDRPPGPSVAAAQPLVPDALAAFLLDHPRALLVDVRDAPEHPAAGGLRLHGRAAVNVPVARLDQAAAGWLRGAAAAAAAGRPQRQRGGPAGASGVAPVWHLESGLALAAPPPHEPAAALAMS